MNTINNYWVSEKLIFKDLLLNEINAVQELFETRNNMSAWAGNDYDSNYINRCYLDGDLPPNGKKENYKIQTIKSNGSNE